MTVTSATTPASGGVAKKRKVRRVNAKMLLARLISSGSSREVTLARFSERVLRDPELTRECVEFFFSLTFGTLTRVARKSADVDRRRRLESMTEETLRNYRSKIRGEAVRLLASVMPNGKPLAECTGTECRAFGGWLVNVADVVGTRKVGDVLSESELWRVRTTP